MKITLIMLIVCGLSLSANGFSQNKRVSLSAKDATLIEIFEKIEATTNFGFLFNDEQLDLTKTYTLEVVDEHISQLLEELLDSDVFRYSIIENNVVITKIFKEEKHQISGRRQQTIIVKGIVSDVNGEPIPGVNIFEKNSPQNGVISGIDGSYTIQVDSPDDLIVYSFIGFADQEVSIAGRTTIDITLVEETTGLDEVVVVGYGTQKKVNLTGAVESVTADMFEDRGVTNVTQTLQGRIPNLNINYSNGGIDATPNINIRGTTGLRYNSDGDLVIASQAPLILIDDVPSDASILSQINPNDIESMSVLKDAAAAAIYGGRAAFGVIIITTKRGKNQKVKITADYNYKVSTPTQFPEFVDTYTHVTTVNEALKRHGSSPRFKDDYIEKVRLYHEDPVNNPIDEIINPVYDSKGNIVSGDYYYYGTVDYMNETFNKSASQQRFDLSLSGGNEKSSIHASLGYLKDEGMYNYGNDDLNIYTMRLNTSTQVTDWMELGARGSYVKHDYDKPYGYRDYYEMTYFQRTYFPIRNRGNGHYLQHAIGYLDSGARDNFEDDDITLNVNTKINVFKDFTVNGSLSYHSNVGLNKENQYKITFADNFGYRYPVDRLWNAKANVSEIYHRTKRKQDMIADVYGQYNRTFNKHDINLMVGFNQHSFNNLYYNASRRDLISQSVPSLNLTLGEDYVNQSEYHWAVRGAFYRINYAFDEKYLVEFNGRYDGSSRFKKESRFGFFPSASAAWRISQEAFMESTRNWLDNLKLRVSYGSLGNQSGVPPYGYIAQMDTYKPSYILGDERPVAVGQPGLIDPSLTWETVTTLNFGLDATLLNNRLNFTGDIYNRHTTDMLVSGDALPGILGTDPPTYNAADLETKGWELSIAWNDRIGQVKYGLRATIADSRAYITKFDNPTGALSRYRVGEELGEIWGYKTEGFFMTEDEAATALAGGSHDQSAISGRKWVPGDIKYADLNGDGKIDKGDVTADDPGDLTIIGNSRARYNYGITANASWKGLNVEAFFQGVGRRHFMPSGSVFWPYASAWDNLQTHQLNDTWTQDNPNAYYPQMEAYADRNYKTQSKYLQNAAYIRLKNVSLSYSLPQNIITKAGLGAVVVSFNGHNLWEAHKLREPFDPEGGNGLQAPYRRSYSFGLKVTL
ncbi:MAG: TonB-dependent receptor [Carboxylicivirga sp.]|nr:TonB-dependent receptor [Carboxylicivirga sp.]